MTKVTTLRHTKGKVPSKSSPSLVNKTQQKSITNFVFFYLCCCVQHFHHLSLLAVSPNFRRPSASASLLLLRQLNWSCSAKCVKVQDSHGTGALNTTDCFTAILGLWDFKVNPSMPEAKRTKYIESCFGDLKKNREWAREKGSAFTQPVPLDSRVS